MSPASPRNIAPQACLEGPASYSFVRPSWASQCTRFRREIPARKRRRSSTVPSRRLASDEPHPRFVHFGADSSSSVVRSSHKTCLGSKETFLLPRPVLQLHFPRRTGFADSEICVGMDRWGVHSRGLEGCLLARCHQGPWRQQGCEGHGVFDVQ